MSRVAGAAALLARLLCWRGCFTRAATLLARRAARSRRAASVRDARPGDVNIAVDVKCSARRALLGKRRAVAILGVRETAHVVSPPQTHDPRSLARAVVGSP